MANQLSYCILSNVSPLDSSTNSYIRIRFDVTSGSSTLTNITDVGGTYSGLNDVRPGQILRAGGSFSSGTTIVSVNTASASITVQDGANTDETNELARIAPGEGEYFIPTASLSDPQQLIDYSNITGSEDSEYITGTNRYGVLGKAYRDGVTIPGRFHLYEILNASARNPSNSEAKLYIRWYESGSEADSGDTMATTTNQTTALLEISDTNELIPIFKSRIVSGFNLDGGEEVAAYQIALEAFFDALSTGSASVSSSFATTASYAHTASVLTGTVTSASFAVTASYAVSSSHEIIQEISSSYAETASVSLSGQGEFSGSFQGDGSSLTSVKGIQEFIVSVINDGGNKYQINGQTAPLLTFNRGQIYRFNLSDSSNTNHPLAFRLPDDTSYTVGVTTNGIAGNAGAYTEINVGYQTSGSLKYYCTVHGNSMGNLVTVLDSHDAIITGSFTGSFTGIGTGIEDIQWSNISNIPSGLLSSSSQIKEYNVFATTGSNLFTDDQTIDGLLILGTQSGVPTFVSGGIYVDSNYDLYLGSI